MLPSAAAGPSYPPASVGQPHDGLQHALELAVKENDLDKAEDILRQGGNPDQLQARCHSDNMRELLTFARRKHLLYPAGASRNKDTELDQALQGWQRDRAQTLLTNKMAGKTIGETWRDAVAQGEVDVQRAILMLEADKDRSFRVLEVGPNMSKKPLIPRIILKLTANKDRSFRAQEGGQVKDPDVIKVLKEIPHYSPKRGMPQDFNGKVPEMVCRHFATHQMGKQAAAPFIKSDYREYQKLKAIVSLDPHVQNYKTLKAKAIASLDPPSMDKKFQHITAHATDTHLVSGRQFGRFLADQFTAMESDCKTTRLMLLNTPTHAMSVGLRIKDKDGNKVYVAKFFDPNRTTSHARSASGALKTFEFQHMRAYLDLSFLGEEGYAQPNVPAIAYIYPEKEDQSDLPMCIAANRTLTTRYIEDHEIDAAVLHCILTRGFAGDLRRLVNEMPHRSEAERLTLLAAKANNETPGFHLTLCNGHADTVKAFGELLQHVPVDRHANLLAANDAKKTPGLYRALQKGHADTVKAFGELLQHVPVDRRADLVAAERADGKVPGLYVALGNGHAGAVKAFGELLQWVPEDLRANLLAARTSDRTPGLNLALRNGHAGAVKAFGELLQWVPQDQRAALLAAERADGAPGLYLARKHGHAEAVKAFGELLQWVPEDQHAKLLAQDTLGDRKQE